MRRKKNKIKALQNQNGELVMNTIHLETLAIIIIIFRVYIMMIWKTRHLFKRLFLKFE